MRITITLRPRLIRGMIIPLEKIIVIPENRRCRNKMIIPIILFSNNSHILIGIQRKLLKKNPTLYIYIFKNKLKKKKIEINWWVADHPLGWPTTHR
jgi:hypothetical protein